jgi:hypothetical protein
MKNISDNIATVIGTIAGIIIVLCLVALIVAGTWWVIRKLFGFGRPSLPTATPSPTWDVKEEKVKRG